MNILHMPLYSHSRLSCFENCPFKFKLKYIEKVRPETETGIEAFLGCQVHETLEKLYTDLKFQKTMTLKELLAVFNDLWAKNWNSRIVIVRSEYKQENYRKMGEKFITDFYKRYHPFGNGRTIGLEKRIVINLDKAGKYKLQGYIDRISYAGKGVYNIHDYKTNANLTTQNYLDRDRQLALYAMAIKRDYKDCKKINLIWHFLAFDKEVSSRRTIKQMKELKKDTIKLIQRIEKEKNFKPNKTTLCNWCEFKPMCTEWAHLYKIEKLPPKKFKKERGVQLVNEINDLTVKKKELGLKIEVLRQELIAYAKQLGVTVVFGSDAKASVKEVTSFKVPAKSSKERAQLEKLIHKYNKWMEVSCLDTFVIKKILKDDKWPKDLLTKTKKLFTENASVSVRFSRLKKEK
jgi:putative RecB family exonuclease